MRQMVMPLMKGILEFGAYNGTVKVSGSQKLSAPQIYSSSPYYCKVKEKSSDSSSGFIQHPHLGALKREGK